MKKKLISILASLALVTTVSLNYVNTNASPAPTKNKSAILQEFKKLSDGKDSSYFENDNGMQLFVTGVLSKETNASFDSVIKFLDDNISLFDMKNLNNGFSPIKIEKDNLGFTHMKLQQTFNGKLVYGKTITIHFDKDGVISGMTGTLENRINSVVKKSNTPLNEKAAIEKAKLSKSFTELSETPVAKKYVYFNGQAAYEVYKVNIVYEQPEIGSWEIFVDVYSGDIIDSISKLRGDGATTGTGVAVNGTSRSLNVYQSGSQYQLKDVSKPMTGTIKTYTANNKNTETGTLVTSSTTTFTDKAAVSAHSYAEVVYNFYKNLFNRNSIDGNGMSIDSVVHYGSKYNNAYWNGYKMIYGDGDGSVFKALSGDLDVVAHEMTHGVTESSANLVYANQPGALNESMSDVLGVLVQTYDKYNVKNGGQWSFNSSDWVVGDEVYTPNTPGDALRSLANPTLYNQPAHMTNYKNLPNTQAGDWGGVHTNSGIPNKAAFLVAQSIGCEKAANIYYRALTVYFNSNTNFSQARLGLVQAAKDLYGVNSTEAQAVMNSFTSVGIN